METEHHTFEKKNHPPNLHSWVRHVQGRVMTVGGDGIASGSHVAILQRPVLPGGSAFGARFNDLL